MMDTYKYNPHQHIKIWLSNNPKIFLNLENCMRLSIMREKNPNDLINLIFDSSLLTPEAQEDLKKYCMEHKIIPIDAHAFETQLNSENERQLFAFYKDEISHLNEGGNLAVGSDILRWLSPTYRLGTYTDFDFPIDTTKLPSVMTVKSPLLLNIGSLKMGKKEFIFVNNDYVAVVNESAAKKQIEKIQRGLIKKLNQYDNDFIEKTVTQFNDNFFKRQLIKLMKNRTETIYISKSKEINQNSTPLSSRKIRNNIRLIMSDPLSFISFNRIANESDSEIITRLRNTLKSQLTLTKCLFFNKEFTEIKDILKLDDNHFLEYSMKKELSHYLKSIIICTTGPIEISNALFNCYVLGTQDIIKKIQPLSFNYYNLQKSFKSQNSIPMHENPIGMIKFLGRGEGEINDSSWLESGRLLQQKRIEQLQEQKNALILNLPSSLSNIKADIEALVKKLSNSSKIIFNARKEAQKEFLEDLLKCFSQEMNRNIFDVDQFKIILDAIHLNKGNVLTGLFFKQTKKLIWDLEQLSHNAVVFGLTQNRKIKWKTISAIECDNSSLDTITS